MDEFDWLRSELASINWRNFHVIGTVVDRTSLVQCLPSSYRRFTSEFGTAKLYKQARGYGLSVLGNPDPAVGKHGEPLLRIGHYLSAKAYFANEDLHDAFEAPVYEWGSTGLRKASDGFAEWLDSRATQLRRKYTRKEWAAIQNGPPPFTQSEETIIRARRLFKWRVLDVSDQGAVRLSVTNKSDLVLPYLSLGVRSKDGSFEGGIWLPVAHVGPGTTAIIEKEVYKGYAAPETLEIYELPDPFPEDRDDYWEFRALPAAS